MSYKNRRLVRGAMCGSLIAFFLGLHTQAFADEPWAYAIRPLGPNQQFDCAVRWTIFGKKTDFDGCALYRVDFTVKFDIKRGETPRDACIRATRNWLNGWVRTEKYLGYALLRAWTDGQPRNFKRLDPLLNQWTCQSHGVIQTVKKR